MQDIRYFDEDIQTSHDGWVFSMNNTLHDQINFTHWNILIKIEFGRLFLPTWYV